MTIRAPIPGLAEGERTLGREASRYLCRVLRMYDGATFLAFDPEARTEADGTMVHGDDDAARVRFGPVRPARVVADVPIVLVYALAKGDKVDTVVRDATELGATRIVVARTSRAVAKIEGDRESKKIERWSRVAEQAARQCGRADPPAIEGVLDWDDALEAAASCEARYVLAVGAAQPLGALLPEAARAGSSIAFAVGPEGGLTDDEVRAAETRGFAPVSLGELVLRTETVAAAVLGAVRVLRTAAVVLGALALVACSSLKSAPAPPDASTDDAGAGPTSTFCDGVTPTPDFCDDFDRGGRVIDAWANANRNPDIGASGGGIIGEDLDNPSSAPRAAALSLPSLVDSTFYASAVLHQGFTAPPPADLTIEFEVLVATEYFPPDGIADILVMSYDGAAQLGILRRDTGTWLTVGKTIGTKLTTPIVVGSWTTLTLVVQNHPVDGGPDGRLTIYVNHRTAADVAFPASLQTVKDQQLDIGPLAKGPIGAFKMLVDNVRVWHRSDL